VAIFLHCVANLNFDDLRLLQEVLYTLENIGTDLEFSQKLFKLCKALCRIAEAFLKDQTPMTNAVSDASSQLPDTWTWLGSQITDTDGVIDLDLDNLDETFFSHGF
jgi:hypothetical protein